MNEKLYYFAVSDSKYWTNQILSKEEFEKFIEWAKEIESKPHTSNSYSNFKEEIINRIANSNYRLMPGGGGYHIWIHDGLTNVKIAQIDFERVKEIVKNDTTKMKLTLQELHHLVELIKKNEIVGEYFGNKTVYWNTSKRLRKKLLKEMELLFKPNEIKEKK